MGRRGAGIGATAVRGKSDRDAVGGGRPRVTAPSVVEPQTSTYAANGPIPVVSIAHSGLLAVHRLGGDAVRRAVLVLRLAASFGGGLAGGRYCAEPHARSQHRAAVGADR